MDWDKLRIFHVVADAGSFTRAGDALNLSQSSVSRQISALEDSLGITLFHRHARGLMMTEQGKTLYQTVHEVFARLKMVEARLSDNRTRPAGGLKVTAPTALGSYWLAPRLKAFVDHYPEIQLELVLDDREVDLGMRAADVAIRLYRPRQNDLVHRHLYSAHWNLYASKDYLARFGTPERIEDLEEHRLIAFGDETRASVPEVNWLQRLGMPPGTRRPMALTINSLYGILRAVRCGVGVGGLPHFMCDAEAELRRVLPEVAGPVTEAYFVYPEELRNFKRIRVFRDFLMSQVAETYF